MLWGRLGGGWNVLVKVRSTRPSIEASVFPDGDDAVVELRSDEIGVAPGQACVFYAPDGWACAGWWVDSARVKLPLFPSTIGA